MSPLGLLPDRAGAFEDFVATEGLLSDDDFYRLIACGAPPDGPCSKPFLRWPGKAAVRVRIASIDPVFLGGKQQRARAALIRAVQYINGAGAGIQVERVASDAPADIDIYLLDTDGSESLQDTGIDGADGARVTGARVMVWAGNTSGDIKRAKILFGTRLHIRHYESAMLEELTQALGLLTDIRNSAYESLSVFSQDSNDAKTFGDQDLMVLRRHYPKDP